MRRKFWKKLDDWSNNNEKMPLMVIGARQVGKTYIIEQFCKEKYKNYCYINLFEDTRLIDWFKEMATFDKKLETLESTYHINLNDKDTILFVDEVQESEHFIEALKIFCERGYSNIICAGSLLGIKLKHFTKSYPVGKLNEEYLYPMDFEEYLWAIGKDNYIDIIKRCFQNNEECLLHQDLMDEYYRFTYLGGMPKVIQNYISHEQKFSLIDSTIIKDIINQYIADMKKYVESNAESIRIERIYKNIPSSLVKENKKFVYAKIDSKDNRKRDYITALDWLVSSYLVLPCYAITKSEYPVLGYLDDETYKLFLNDTGILSNMVGISATDILTNGDYSFKGVLAENYVATELIKQEFSLLYWSKKNDNSGQAEVDFVIQKDNRVIPIEVKAGTDMLSKSLSVYNEIFKPQIMVKICAKNFGMKDNLKTIPLYATFLLKELL